ncbi:MAG: PEP-CTERM sorting domain-containing protein [Cyanobacteria bacterium P01_G01_bin.49]
MIIPSYQKLTLVAASTALSLNAIAIESTQAATVTYQFKADLVESILLEGFPEIGLEANPDFYKGKLTFDDSLLTNMGFESLGVEDGLSVVLTSDPRINEELDPRFPDFPIVTFQDGELLGLDWFAVYHPFTNVPELNYPGDFLQITGTELTDGFDPTFYTPEEEPRSPVLGFGTVEYASVPEPSAIIGLAFFVLGAGSKLKRKKP